MVAWIALTLAVTNLLLLLWFVIFQLRMNSYQLRIDDNLIGKVTKAGAWTEYKATHPLKGDE